MSLKSMAVPPRAGASTFSAVVEPKDHAAAPGYPLMPIGLGWREGGIPEPDPRAEDWWKNTAYPGLGKIWDWARGNPLEAASASSVPGVSDVADVAMLGRDLYRFGTEPSRETAVNLGLGAAGAALPFLGAGWIKAAAGYAPQKTQKAYKLFEQHPKDPNLLLPLFVGRDQPIPFGEWLIAEAGQPGRAPGKVKSTLGDLAYRPGWHAGDVPVATHIGGKSDPSLTAPDHRPDKQVWAEVEMADDQDWQSVANARARITKAGTPDPKTAHITDQVPLEGYYRYKTNPNMTGEWLIGGNMRVNRILSDEEVEAANKAAGVSDLPRLSKLNRGADLAEVPALAKTEMRQLVGGGGSLEEAQGRLQQLGPGHGLRRSPTHPGVYFTVREPQAPEVGAAAAPTSSEPAHFVFKADPATSETVERLAGRVTSGVNDRAGLGNKGQYVYDNNSILLDSSLSPEQRHDTLTHELGHAMAAKGGVVDPRGLAWQGAPPAQVLEQIRALSAGRRPHLWGSNEELENAFPHLGAAAISKYRERPDELAADLVASMIADPAKAKQVGHEAYRWAASKLNASDLGKIAQFLGVPLAMVSAALAQASGLEPEEAPPPPATAGGIGLGR
jgi:hypothetical protein